jgi:hypothetical protein
MIAFTKRFTNTKHKTFDVLYKKIKGGKRERARENRRFSLP